MKRAVSIGLAAFVTLAGVSAGHTATVIKTDTFGIDQDTYVDASVNEGPGRYKFTLDLSAQPSGVLGDAIKTFNYDFFCDFNDGNGVVACGGDDYPVTYAFNSVSPTRYEAIVTVNPPSSSAGPFPYVRTDNYDRCCEVRLDIYSDTVGTYKLSVGSVPEPATWSMMIIGFGAVGAALRRRVARGLASERPAFA